MHILEMVTKMRLTAAEELKRRNQPMTWAQHDLIKSRFINLFTPQIVIDLLDEIESRTELLVLRNGQIDKMREKLEMFKERSGHYGQALVEIANSEIHAPKLKAVAARVLAEQAVIAQESKHA